jgi:hypothetical protein
VDDHDDSWDQEVAPEHGVNDDHDEDKSVQEEEA